MSIQTYPNGFGGLGSGNDPLGLARPIYTSGNIWYVSSLNGFNAGPPAGQNREKPLSTIAQAAANAVSGDIVVFLPGHVQALSALLTISKELTFIGEGTDASGKPSVAFLPLGNQALFNITGAGCEFRNIWFPQRAVVSTQQRVIIGADDVLFSDCYFECGSTDSERAMVITGNRARIRRCTFVSTATTRAVQPKSAIELGLAANIVGLELTDCVIDAGTVGFSAPSAIDFTTAVSVTRLRVQGLSLLHGADVDFSTGGVISGRVNVQLATGGSRVAWS